MSRQPSPKTTDTEQSITRSDVLAMGFHPDDFPVVLEAWRAAKAGEMPYFSPLGPVVTEGLSWTPGTTIRDPAGCFLINVESSGEMYRKFGACWYTGNVGANKGAMVCEALWQIAIWWREWKERLPASNGN